MTVVDNASPDDSLGDDRGPRRGRRALAAQRRLLLRLQPRRRARRRARTCSSSTRTPASTPAALAPCGRPSTRDPRSALVGPRMLDEDGALAWSLRRFPRQRSTFAQALFLHRLLAAGRLDRRARARPGRLRAPGHARIGSPAPACSSAATRSRRSAGFDEGFFLYCEDTDLCRRLWDAGHAGALRARRGGAPRGRRLLRRRRDPGDRRPQPRALRAQAHRDPRAARRAGARRGARRGHARRGGAPAPRLAPRPPGGAARRPPRRAPGWPRAATLARGRAAAAAPRPSR